MVSRRFTSLATLLFAAALIAGCGSGETLAPLNQGLDSAPPSAPANVREISTPDGKALAWDANVEADLAGYDIYVYSPDPTRENAYVKVNSSLVTGTEWLVEDATLDGAYFRVKAVDTSANGSAASSVARVASDRGTDGSRDQDDLSIRR